MAELLDPNHAFIRVKVWKEETGPGEDDFRLHLVSADDDVPNNGIHISVRRHTDTFQNLAQMLDNLAASAADK
ncbi:MAG: hypothetical protein M3134_11045 [Actinomycetota bacterium]|nr:hypothetical protein [Actinomycetota bacterium]